MNNISLILGGKSIFRGLNWEVQQEQKVGLIGPNGAGKSSLFKLITGEYTAEKGGNIIKTRGISIGYLAQEPGVDLEKNGFDVLLRGNVRLMGVREELTLLETSMGERAVYSNPLRLTAVLERQRILLEEYQSLGGDQYPERVKTLLRGLGLAVGEELKPMRVLSGGQKKLIGLAQLLLNAPDVLLLDEPDNHLDLSGKVYLERLIQTYPGIVVIISHD
ncbi:MAG: ATP-binding cassette domain-containing protein [Chloroflexi bacterium]|nr:ATP-binding cassette domain-containing protein [Chloroflexota bacterium]